MGLENIRPKKERLLPGFEQYRKGMSRETAGTTDDELRQFRKLPEIVSVLERAGEEVGLSVKMRGGTLMPDNAYTYANPTAHVIGHGYNLDAQEHIAEHAIRWRFRTSGKISEETRNQWLAKAKELLRSPK